jgi:hypothetical protein
VSVAEIRPKARDAELRPGEPVELREGLFIRKTPDGKIEFFDEIGKRDWEVFGRRGRMRKGLRG